MTTQLELMLKRKARYWAGEVTKLAKAFAPDHIKNTKAITSHVEEKQGGTFVIKTIADPKIAPDVWAQEFGSGLHARRGKKAKYPIRPKSGHKFLAFNWEVANKNPDQFMFNDKGQVLLPIVQHPGIQAVNSGHGYIRLAEIEIRKRIKKELDDEVPNAIRAELRISFSKGKK